MNTFKELIPSRRLRIIAYVVGIVVVELLVFHAGAVWGARGVFGPGADREWEVRAPGMPPMGMPHGFMMSGHGAVGDIKNVSLPSSFVMQTRDGSVETIILASSTALRDEGDHATDTSALTSGTYVIVLGQPAAGNPDSIDAELVRLVPAPPDNQ